MNDNALRKVLIVLFTDQSFGRWFLLETGRRFVIFVQVRQMLVAQLVMRAIRTRDRKVFLIKQVVDLVILFAHQPAG